jgi:hypothetical protein
LHLGLQGRADVLGDILLQLADTAQAGALARINDALLTTEHTREASIVLGESLRHAARKEGLCSRVLAWPPGRAAGTWHPLRQYRLHALACIQRGCFSAGSGCCALCMHAQVNVEQASIVLHACVLLWPLRAKMQRTRGSN